MSWSGFSHLGKKKVLLHQKQRCLCLSWGHTQDFCAAQMVLRGLSSENLTDHPDRIQRQRRSSGAHVSLRLAKDAQGKDNQHSKGSQHFSLGTADWHFLLFETTSQPMVLPPFLGSKPGSYCNTVIAVFSNLIITYEAANNLRTTRQTVL